MSLKRYSWTRRGQDSIDVYATFSSQQRFGSAAAVSSHTIPGVLSEEQANNLAVRLTPGEREVLIAALQKCQSQKLKAEYVGKSDFGQ